MLRPTREDYIKELTLWLGTPWKAQQAHRGLYTDCIGLIIGSFKNLGYEFDYPVDYEQTPNGFELLDRLESYGFTKTSVPSIGDLAIYRFNGIPHHVGVVYSGSLFIHASRFKKRVALDSLETYKKWLVCYLDSSKYLM